MSESLKWSKYGKNEIKKSALELIGNTPLVALDRLHPGPGRILAKCEFMNPGGSIKDRTALAMIQKAKETGELKPGAPVVETTSGNLGCGLAVVCAVLGHPLTGVMSNGNSVQRSIHMEALGAKCVRVPQVEGVYGRVTIADVEQAQEVALRVVEDTGAYHVNQANNKNNPRTHFDTTGPEIWRQAGEKVDAFVSCVGSAGTFIGTVSYLKRRNIRMKAFVVEPDGSEPIKGDHIKKSLHLLQGAGYAWIPPLFDFKLIDGTIPVTEEETLEYRRLIGYKEGLFVGYTSGAAVAAAVKLLQSGKMRPDAYVVVTLNDTGLKYTPVPLSLFQQFDN